MTCIPHSFTPHDGSSFRPVDCSLNSLIILRNGQERRAITPMGFWIWDARTPMPSDIVGYVRTPA